MTDQTNWQRASTQRQRERQYEIDRVTEQYADEYRRGRAPRMEEYLRRYPQYAQELLEFGVYFHSVELDIETLDGPPDSDLSPAAQKALARIRTQPAPGQITAIEGLVKQGVAVGYSPKKLAEAVGLTTDLLGKLEARAIAIATVPITLVRRLAETLQVAPEAVATYLGAAHAGQAGAFYYADQPPTQQQQSFLDAVQASALSGELKQEWAKIVQEEAGAGQ